MRSFIYRCNMFFLKYIQRTNKEIIGNGREKLNSLSY